MRACTLFRLFTTQTRLCIYFGPRVRLVHTSFWFWCVCVVTPTKCFRVECGNAHPAYLVLMRAQLHHRSCTNWAGLAHIERTDVLNDLLNKAQFELDDTRHAVSNAAHNFAMLKQSLVDQPAQDNKALEKAKADHFVSSRESRSRGSGESLVSWRRHRSQARTVVFVWPRNTRPPWNLLRTS